MHALSWLLQRHWLTVSAQSSRPVVEQAKEKMALEWISGWLCDDGGQYMTSASSRKMSTRTTIQNIVDTWSNPIVSLRKNYKLSKTLFEHLCQVFAFKQILSCRLCYHRNYPVVVFQVPFTLQVHMHDHNEDGGEMEVKITSFTSSVLENLTSKLLFN